MEIEEGVGLKQSGRAWNKRLDSTLRAIGLQKSTADPCVYLKEGNKRRLIIAVYVDDLLIFSNDKREEQRVKQYLKNNFEMKDLGSVKKCLGMTIERDISQGELYLHQANHIEYMLQKFAMKNCNPVSTPMDPNVKLSSEMELKTEEDQRGMKRVPYLEAVGSLLYISQISRPDIAFAVNRVSSFNKNPGKPH